MKKPDFMIVPMVVKDGHGIQPSDCWVYAVVYWLEKMRGEKCTAANTTIADVAGVKARTVRAALDRLEQAGFIERVYKDEERKIRTEIRCLVHYGVVPSGSVEKMEKKVAEIVRHEPRKETPGEAAARFFDRGDTTLRREIVAEIVASGGNEVQVVGELRKFAAYWTEPNKSGTRVRWQLERTFDVRRRIATWFARAGSGQRSGARSGAGVTV